MKYLWIATAFLGTDFPKVERYELVEQTKRGYRVKLRGSQKLICKSAERYFFTDEVAVEKWLRTYVTQRMEYAKRLVTRCEDALKKPLACAYYEQIAAERVPWMDEPIKLK